MTAEICLFEGDDAAPEAFRPTVDLLKTLDLDLSFVSPDVEEYAEGLREGWMPDGLAAIINDADTVLYGASSRELYGTVGWYLRNQYGGGLPVNVRPIRYINGADSPLKNPEGIDYVILRENLEGLYVRSEGELDDLTAKMPDLEGMMGKKLREMGPGKYAIRVTTERATKQFAELACAYADRHGEGDDILLTCASKSNALPETDGLFDAIVKEIADEYDSLTYEHLHIDNLGQLLTTDPTRFEFVVTPNIMGDIMSDVGAGTIGGLGLAPSGCYSDTNAYFEPVHGTAPDIEGENIINPTATILSAVMMLQYLEFDDAAERLEHAVHTVYQDRGNLTPDQGGSASTTEMANAIKQEL